MRKCLKISLILFLSSAMAACTTGGAIATLLVGGVAGGYYVGKDKRDINTIAQDATTTSTIKSWYVGDKNVKALNINVDTYQGVVTLYGTVDTKEAEMNAMKIAAKAKGVTKVVSKLTVINDAPIPATPTQEPLPSGDGFIEELP